MVPYIHAPTTLVTICFWDVFSNIFSLASRSLDVLTGLLDQLEEEELAAEAQEEGFAEDDG